MTVELPAGENADDSANQSTVSILKKLLKKGCHQKIPSFSILPRLNYQCRKFLRRSAIEIFLSDSTSLAE